MSDFTVLSQKDYNDLLARLEVAKSLLKEASRMQWEDDVVYAEWRKRIDAFLWETE